MQLKKRELVCSLPRTSDRLLSNAGSSTVIPFRRSWVISMTGMLESVYSRCRLEVGLDIVPVVHHTCKVKGLCRPDNWERGAALLSRRQGLAAWRHATCSLSILPPTTWQHNFVKAKHRANTLQLLVPQPKVVAYRTPDARTLDAHHCAFHKTVDRYRLPIWRKSHCLATLVTTQSYKNSSPNRSKQGRVS